MATEEDARSEASFQSADDEEDDFDLPQDVGGPRRGSRGSGDYERAAGDAGGALPPGFEDEGEGGIERWNLRKDGNKEQLEPIWARLSEEREHVKISKMFSYVLRHAAHKMDVRIRKDGFVQLREIMKLRNFKPYNLEELMAVVYFDEKERYTMVREFDGELLIRANQGHTMKVVEDDLLLEQIVHAEEGLECVHGTYLVHWPFIKRQGLSKVARNHIHLANGLPEDGKIRGMRSTAELFIYVDLRAAMRDGMVFYRSKNDVILTQGLDGWLPPKYFVKAVRIDYNTCDIEELEFDVTCEAPNWPSDLAPSGPGEQGTYLIKNLEALISNCRKRLQDIHQLQAREERGEELTRDEEDRVSKHAQVYTELQSLEQRFRQHKGHRRETAHEKEQRTRDEAESSTIVSKKDRAVTPPWERNKPSALKSVGGSVKQSEKEKAEWAALGNRRDSAATKERPQPAQKDSKRDDPWENLGRGRHDGNEKTSASKKPTPEASGPIARSISDKAAPGSSERPRFFNSKLSKEGGSWRDRMSSGGPESDAKKDSWRSESEKASPKSSPQPQQLQPQQIHQQQPPQQPAQRDYSAVQPQDLSRLEKLQLLQSVVQEPRTQVGPGQASPQLGTSAVQLPQQSNSQLGVNPMQSPQHQWGGVYPGAWGGGMNMQQGYFVPQRQNADGSMAVAPQGGGWMQAPQQYMASSLQNGSYQGSAPSSVMMQQGYGGCDNMVFYDGQGGNAYGVSASCYQDSGYDGRYGVGYEYEAEDGQGGRGWRSDSGNQDGKDGKGCKGGRGKGKDWSGKGGGGKPGAFGADRGDQTHDWAALGRTRATA